MVTICDGRTKCDKRYYIFWHDKLSQNVTSVVIISDRYYKKQNCYYILRSMRYYKKRQVLLQFTTGISKCKDLLLYFAICALLQKEANVITIYGGV